MYLGILIHRGQLITWGMSKHHVFSVMQSFSFYGCSFWVLLPKILERIVHIHDHNHIKSISIIRILLMGTSLIWSWSWNLSYGWALRLHMHVKYSVFMECVDCFSPVSLINRRDSVQFPYVVYIVAFEVHDWLGVLQWYTLTNCIHVFFIFSA